MEVITTSVLAALASLAEPAIKDAYNGLKALIVRKLGPQSRVTRALDDAEATPDSKGRKVVVEEELAAAKLEADVEIVKAAEALLAKIQERGGSVRVTASGAGAVAAGGNITGSTITTHGNARPSRS